MHHFLISRLLVTLIFSIGLSLFFPLLPTQASTTAASTEPVFEVGFPGIPKGTSIKAFAESQGLVGFFRLLINVVLAVVVAAGLISFVIAGYFYMTAGGNSQRLETAKSLMAAAILGIVLALTAQIVLNTISPQFAEQVQKPEFGSPK